MEKIAIIILNFNGKEDTIACINSFNKINGIKGEVEIIVVDNGSKDNSVEEIRDKYKRITILENKTNLGYAEGNNVGISYALGHGASHILIINNDTTVDKNFLKELLEVIERNTKIGITVPKIYFAKGFEFHKDRYKKEELGKVIWYAGGTMDWKNVIGCHKGVDEVDRGQYDLEEQVYFASGNCMLVSRSVFEKIGFFDKNYFLYYEDSDFSQRVRRAGFSIMYVPSAVIWHKNAASSGGSGSDLQDYYITRNRLIFGMRYAPFRSKAALLKESITLLSKGRMWQKRGILDFYKRNFGKGSFTI